MPDKEQAHPLVEWSKWLIGINFAAATGCIIAFKDPKPLMIGIPLFLAICFFSISTMCSVILIYRIATDNPGDKSVLVQHKTIAFYQLVLFILALIFICVWIGIKGWDSRVIEKRKGTNQMSTTINL